MLAWIFYIVYGRVLSIAASEHFEINEEAKIGVDSS
jgi:hypothetical protein